MANRWTGDYEALAQASSGGMDRFLAALHAKGSRGVGKRPASPTLIQNYWVNLPISGVEDSGSLAGLVALQAGPPAVSVPRSGGGDRLTLSFPLRAELLGSPDPSSPRHAHGVLQATADLGRIRGRRENLVEIDLTGAGLAVDFDPASGSGIGAGAQALVEKACRGFLRNALAPVQVRVPVGGSGVSLKSFDLHALPGSPSAVALGLTLRGSAPAQGDPGTEGVFVRSGEDLAVALSVELLEEASKALAARALGRLAFDFEVPLSFLGFVFGRLRYSAQPDLAGLRLRARPGKLDLVLEGKAVGEGSLPDFRFRIRQGFTVEAQNGALQVAAAGDPSVENLDGGIRRAVWSAFRGRVESAVGRALGRLESTLGQQARTHLGRAVERFVGALALPRAQAEITDAVVDEPGLRLHLRFDLGAPQAPVARFRQAIRLESGGGPWEVVTRLDPMKSWIPGGWIERFEWSRLRSDGSVANTAVQRHELVMEHRESYASARSVLWPGARWCLEIRGIQGRFPNGAPRWVSTRHCATALAAPPLPPIPPEILDGLTVELPGLEGEIVVQPAGRGALGRAGFLLAYFLGQGVELDGAILAAASRVADEKGAPVFPLAVAAPEGELPSFGDSGVAVTRDAHGAWRELLEEQAPGSAVLVGPEGKILWRYSGATSRETLEEALEQHLRPTEGVVQVTDPAASLPIGQEAPDLLLPFGESRVSLRRFRGREIRLAFLRPGHEPSEAERERLAEMAAGEEAPLVVTVEWNAGEGDLGYGGDTAAGLHPVADPRGEIARGLGVRVWPTVLQIDEGGRIVDYQLGHTPEPLGWLEVSEGDPEDGGEGSGEGYAPEESGAA